MRVTCVDGRVLTVVPAPVLDRDGRAYEVVLGLLLDGRPLGEVGERCAYFLAAALERLAGPVSSLEAGVRAWAVDADLDPAQVWSSLQPHLPRDRELLALRARDPDDLAATGELRVLLRTERRFVSGRWQLRDTAVVEAWGSGTGVRAELDHDALREVLTVLLAECAAVGVVPGP